MKQLRIIVLYLMASVGLYLLMFFAATRVNIGTYTAIHSISDALNIKGGNTWQKFREFDPQQQYDVVFIGSSHAYRGYDPRIFAEQGIKAFNLGTSSQTMMNSYFVIEEYLTAENTSTIVLDVFAAAFELDGLEATADLSQNISSTSAATGMAWALHDPRGLNMIVLRLLTMDRRPYYLDTAYVGRGFSEITSNAPADIVYVPDYHPELSECQWRYFERIIELCEQRNIELILVDHPAPQQTKGPRYQANHARLSQVAQEHGLQYVDLAYEHPLDAQQHFYDHTHLNQAGVEWFNAELLQLFIDRNAK